MPLTAANFAANLKTARTVVAQRLGFDPSNLTYDQRTQYNKALAGYISQYPNSFSALTLDIARRELQQGDYPALSDTGLDLGAFVDAAVANAQAINPLDPQNIGTVGKYLLGAAAVVVFGYLVVKLLLRPKSSA